MSKPYHKTTRPTEIKLIRTISEKLASVLMYISSTLTQVIYYK